MLNKEIDLLLVEFKLTKITTIEARKRIIEVFNNHLENQLKRLGEKLDKVIEK